MSTTASTLFHVMTKPIGPICNLDCNYCFYLEKESLYPDARQWRMSDEVLENYIRQYIDAQPTTTRQPDGSLPPITFAWQGGEPTLLGVRFFEKAVALQSKYANGRAIENALQTNGTLLDDDWCRFLAQRRFLVGLSIDGPRELHDLYRVDKKGQPSFDQVMRGLRLLQKHNVEYNTLTVVHRENARKPLEVYRFLKKIGSKFLQFIPLVERQSTTTAVTVNGLSLAEPPMLGPQASRENLAAVTPWSVLPEDYGRFLCSIYDTWVRGDVGQVYVQMFDVCLGIWSGHGSSICLFTENCGKALAIEHNGDLYSCDHYVYPRYHLGNVLNQSLAELVDSPAQQQFGLDKSQTLPQYCRSCEVRFACNGECPKHRFLNTPDGESGLNYLCAAYKQFFKHIDPTMKQMTALLQAGQPPARIMEMIRQGQRR